MVYVDSTLASGSYFWIKAALGSVLCGYSIGAVPTAYLLVRWWYGVSLLTHGSGNSGATNAYRVTQSKVLFVLIFALDAMKSFIPLVLLNWYVVPVQAHAYFLPYLMALAILVGNGYSVFLNFRGGKAVAVSAGSLMALYGGGVFGVYILFWLCGALLCRRTDVGALYAVTVGTVTITYFFTLSFLPLLFLYVLSGWVLVRHASNIRTLMR